MARWRRRLRLFASCNGYREGNQAAFEPEFSFVHRAAQNCHRIYFVSVCIIIHACEMYTYVGLNCDGRSSVFCFIAWLMARTRQALVSSVDAAMKSATESDDDQTHTHVPGIFLAHCILINISVRVRGGVSSRPPVALHATC